MFHLKLQITQLLVQVFNKSVKTIKAIWEAVDSIKLKSVSKDITDDKIKAALYNLMNKIIIIINNIRLM